MNKLTKNIILILYTIAITACSNAQKSNSSKIAKDSVQNISKTKNLEGASKHIIDSSTCGLNFTIDDSYYNSKNEIQKIRTQLNNRLNRSNDSLWQEEVLIESMNTFSNYLLNKIIPHWYETVWDFEGHTAIPNQGTIACGYFVSTTLRDMGINLNRYKLAQQAPENEALSIAIDSSQIIYSDENNISKLLKKLDNGLYFVGLDNHVGYLYINDSNSYFIHSNYIDGKVMIEYTEHSDAFYSFQYYISNISSNKYLIRKWLENVEVAIKTD